MPPAEMDPAVQGIADRIKEVRERCGLSQEDFAHAIGVTRSHLSDIETYRIEPSIVALLGVLGIHLAGVPDKGQLPAEPVNARWLLLGPAPMRDDYRPARRTRRKVPV